jgi:hypothetical protein
MHSGEPKDHEIFARNDNPHKRFSASCKRCRGAAELESVALPSPKNSSEISQDFISGTLGHYLALNPSRVQSLFTDNWPCDVTPGVPMGLWRSGRGFCVASCSLALRLLAPFEF